MFKKIRNFTTGSLFWDSVLGPHDLTWNTSANESLGNILSSLQQNHTFMLICIKCSEKIISRYGLTDGPWVDEIASQSHPPVLGGRW